MKRLLIIFLVSCCKLYAQDITVDTIWIGNAPVRMLKMTYGGPSRVVFINLHENEYTSVEATKEYLQNRDGVLISLQQEANRLICFDLKGRLIQFDPNRMFSERGRTINLKLLNGHYPLYAEKMIRDFSGKITASLEKARVVIAMHNNSDGRPLSVKSYKHIYVNPAMDTDDFILTTEQWIFDQLKEQKINTVLQNQKTSADDGSLAIYCSKKKIPYINVEAEEGHQEEQLRMLNALTGIINQYAAYGH